MASHSHPGRSPWPRSRDAAEGRAEVTNSIVTVRALKKQFGKTEILHGLDFDIPAGRIYGLVGHNGAGKTTTLNAILALTSCEGTVRVLGEDPYAKRAPLM